MSTELIPAGSPAGMMQQPQTPMMLAPGSHAPPPQSGNQVARLFAAVKRYRWAVLAATVAGTIGGVVATRFIKPQYEAYATVFLSGDTKKGNEGPIRSQEMIQQQGWIELLNSFEVTDQVVRRIGLFVGTDSPKDSVYFRGFQIKEKMLPGDYTLKTDKTGKAYVLARAGVDLDKGQFGDSVGAKLGFIWKPKSPGPDKNIKFNVKTPRDASVELRKQFTAVIPQFTPFLRLKLIDENGERAATTLNRWLEEFTNVSSRIKKRNIVEFAGVLEDQLKTAQKRLNDAETSLENFRVKTITEPSEVGTAISAGTQDTKDPTFRAFFDQKVQYENIRRDREALEKLIADSRSGPNPGVITAEALIGLPGVVQGSPALGEALKDVTEKQAKLRAFQQVYTDDYKAVTELKSAVRTLQTQTIPQAALAMLDQLRRQEEAVGQRINSAGAEMRKIPQRTIEEGRLRREVEVAGILYTQLLAKYNEARMSTANAEADVTVLDTAIAPLDPTRNTTPGIIFGGILAGLALGIAVAFVLDRLDRRFRYPEQATDELGLEIVGFVPSLKVNRRGERDPVATAQVVEAFRTLRLSLQHLSVPNGPVVVTITSPMSGDGKSLIASNLAVSFAESGMRTLLIDGDVRRGALHSAFSVPQVPGVVDVLAGRATLLDALRPEVQPNLALIPCGTRTARAPELLNSPLDQMFRALRSQYDVIVVDSPPLGAGADSLALAIVAGATCIVLRAGETDRKMADAKLRVMDKLPVRVLGAILNDVTPDGEYAYYSYLSEYYQEDREPEAEPPREMTEEMRLSRSGIVRQDIED
ncbi:MAG: polysaccharide biosynthesis tyrosine autokinase [Gemmatimonadetes bacterium]|nr:polysaccharide biosynthesis tyrosine autokinase [Gemmatimonadota bacterium]